MVLGAALWPLPDVRSRAHADDRNRTVGSIDRGEQRAVIVAVHDEVGTRATDDAPERLRIPQPPPRVRRAPAVIGWWTKITRQRSRSERR